MYFYTYRAVLRNRFYGTPSFIHSQSLRELSGQRRYGCFQARLGHPVVQVRSDVSRTQVGPTRPCCVSPRVHSAALGPLVRTVFAQMSPQL